MSIYDNGRGTYNPAMIPNHLNQMHIANMNNINGQVMGGVVNNPNTYSIRPMIQPRNGNGNNNNNKYNNNNNNSHDMNHNNNHNHNHNHHNNHSNNNNHNNNNGNNNNNNNNNNNGGNKGPTKDTWISPFKSAEQNMNFFMYMYKCQPCHMRRNCPSKVTCPNWHHEGEKRRNPGEEPNFLYSEEPCPNVKPQGSNKWLPPSRCTDGDHCGYSHTLLEQMYHPNIYKTSICINFTNPQGNKCQWGYYCTHAHGQEDIRNPNKKSSPSSCTTSTPSTTHSDNNPTQSSHSIKRPKPRSYSENKPPQYRMNKDNSHSGSNSHMISPPTMLHTQQQHQHPYVSPQPKRKADFSPLPVRSSQIHNAMQHNVPPMNLPISSHHHQHHHQPPQMFPYSHNTTAQQMTSYYANKVRTKRSQSVDTAQYYGHLGAQQHHGHLSGWVAPVAPPMYEEFQHLNTTHHTTLPMQQQHVNTSDPTTTTTMIENPYSKKKTVGIGVERNGNGSRSAGSLNGVNEFGVIGGTPPPITAANRIVLMNDQAPGHARSGRSRSFNNLWEDANVLTSAAGGGLHQAQSVPDNKKAAREWKNRFNLSVNAGNTRKNRTQSEPPLPSNIWATDNNHGNGMLSKDDMLPNADPALATVFSGDGDGGGTITTPNGLHMQDFVDTPTDITGNPITDWFPFLPNELEKAKQNNNNVNDASFPDALPSTPPAPPDNIDKLREQLHLAMLEIDRLRKKKIIANANVNVNVKDDVYEKLNDLPSFGTSTKKSFNMNKLEMEENKTQMMDDEELKRQQLLRYEHFITCPSCSSKDNERNRVLIPCGHLICNECVNDNDDGNNDSVKMIEKCPICDNCVENYQILKIG